MNENELARALFDEYSAARNSVRNDYCMFWENLDSAVRQTWLIVARGILNGTSVVAARHGDNE